MARTATVSVRLDPLLNDQLAAVAEDLDPPKSWVIEQAVRENCRSRGPVLSLRTEYRTIRLRFWRCRMNVSAGLWTFRNCPDGAL